jgi:hypothetical protein
MPNKIVAVRDGLIACAVAMALGVVFSMRVHAGEAGGGAPPKAQSAAAKTPDLTGVWRRSRQPPDNSRKYTHYETMALTVDKPPMTAWALERYNAAKPFVGPRAIDIGKSNDPTINCFPPGVPRIYLIQTTMMEILQQPGRVMMYFEYDHFVREIFTDGRKHTEDGAPTWMGEAIGHWEGDTLVVDTRNFNDKTWLDYDGLPHSDQMHVVERIRRVDAKNLEITMTIEDPKAYTKPWTTHLRYEARPDWKIEESMCADNVNFSEMNKLSEPDKK